MSVTEIMEFAHENRSTPGPYPGCHGTLNHQERHLLIDAKHLEVLVFGRLRNPHKESDRRKALPWHYYPMSFADNCNGPS